MKKEASIEDELDGKHTCNCHEARLSCEAEGLVVRTSVMLKDSFLATNNCLMIIEDNDGPLLSEFKSSSASRTR